MSQWNNSFYQVNKLLWLFGGKKQLLNIQQFQSMFNHEFCLTWFGITGNTNFHISKEEKKINMTGIIGSQNQSLTKFV